MNVPRYNYASQFGSHPEVLFASIERMLLDGTYILSKEVAEFEEAFGRYLGIPYVCGVNSGTDALILALRSLDVGPGDEVITQANTFYATVAAIRLVGATPVLVDADEESFLIDESEIPAVITSRSKAIIAVHLYGKPTPMRGILEMAGRHNIAVIEDAAQAHGARINNQATGTFGDVGCFSFHPSKNLAAAGDAGAVVCKSSAMAERIRCLRELGQRGQNNHVMLGINSKLDALQARILSWKLPHLDAWNEKRRSIAAIYREYLSDLPVQFQSVTPGEEHAYHLFQIRTSRSNELLEHLRQSRVDAVVRYPLPIHLQPAFSDCKWRPGQFPVAERLSRELLCLPIRPDITIAEVDYVCRVVKEFFSNATWTTKISTSSEVSLRS